MQCLLLGLKDFGTRSVVLFVASFLLGSCGVLGVSSVLFCNENVQQDSETFLLARQVRKHTRRLLRQ
jgi:hypothetical protein